MTATEDYVRRAINAAVFGIPAEAIDAVQEQVTALIVEAEARGEARAQAPSGWIAVGDRMPEDGQAVFFVVEGESTEGHFDTGCGGCWNDDTGAWPPSLVTHWMPRFVQPLPAPPEAP